MLMKHLNGNISVKLKNGVEYRGRMVQCDNLMNVILDGAVEYDSDTLVANYGHVFIRGNNILYICVNHPSV
jgi:small nuclear ribonucleoprotein (snRNP)-like protein